MMTNQCKMRNITSKIKQKENLHISVANKNHRVVKERQIDPTIEHLTATATTEQNTVPNPISIVHEEGEKIMIYTTIITTTCLLPTEREEM